MVEKTACLASGSPEKIDDLSHAIRRLPADHEIMQPGDADASIDVRRPAPGTSPLNCMLLFRSAAAHPKAWQASDGLLPPMP